MNLLEPALSVTFRAVYRLYTMKSIISPHVICHSTSAKLIHFVIWAVCLLDLVPK